MRKLNFIISIAGTFLLTTAILNPKVFADTTKSVSHLVMEHEIRIGNLETQVNELSTTKKPLTEEMKQTLVKEYTYRIQDQIIDSMDDADGHLKMNLVDYRLVEKNGENVFQLYFDDDFKWVLDSSDPNAPTPYGRVFALSFSNKVHDINEFYGVDVKVEYYEDGKQITNFIK
jgi:hypothetical protein